MRGHKFLIVLGELLDIEDNHMPELADPGVNGSGDEPYARVITCAHERFGDNVVELEGTDYYGEEISLNVVRDIKGRLWYYTHALSKLDIIRMFEQEG